REPQFRILGADRRDKQVKALLRDRLRLFDPGDVETLQRLDACRCVILQASKHEQAIVRPAYLCIRDIELICQPVFSYLVLNKLLDRILDGILYLAKANRPHLSAKRAENEIAAEEVALARSTTTPCSLVSRRSRERLENLGELNPSEVQ